MSVPIFEFTQEDLRDEALSAINHALRLMCTEINRLGGDYGTIRVASKVGAVGEAPTGVVDGKNAVFTLSHTPAANSVAIFVNGIRQNGGYNVTGNTITFTVAPSAMSNISVDYQYGPQS